MVNIIVLIFCCKYPMQNRRRISWDRQQRFLFQRWGCDHPCLAPRQPKMEYFFFWKKFYYMSQHILCKVYKQILWILRLTFYLLLIKIFAHQMTEERNNCFVMRPVWDQRIFKMKGIFLSSSSSLSSFLPQGAIRIYYKFGHRQAPQAFGQSHVWKYQLYSLESKTLWVTKLQIILLTR